ncbi:tRNA (adenine22-N1)-methyltransferase [Lactobacillus colini]|uniref:tRNA (Adenine22-N1)-methyltransferase n=1 Tax=Lactobacillus colini TaxID=1819254 RepID=A0ABS4MCJ5_9LACO|nr:class I SAM-dependent methyltransferase [Lactobacillus colini]MBP2057061.1 tRNA (adenine22-N1)-methyltransferase [Lactobacillus colini]
MEERLAQLAKMVDQGARIADIGTDHAYLPIELVKDGKVNFAVASDVAKGPLQNAQDDIEQAGLLTQISTRLGSGLSTIREEDKIDTVIIAGMGGKLMVDLLEKAKENKQVYPTLILEPNVGEANVRSWLSNNNYKIIQEKIIKVAGHIYELIKAEHSHKAVPLSLKDIIFGPILVKEKNEVFHEKWTNQLAYQKNLINNLSKAKNINTEKINQSKELIKMIKEVIEK